MNTQINQIFDLTSELGYGLLFLPVISSPKEADFEMDDHLFHAICQELKNCREINRHSNF